MFSEQIVIDIQKFVSKFRVQTGSGFSVSQDYSVNVISGLECEWHLRARA